MARGLAASCKGKPPTVNSGGRLAQLKLLRAGRHPLTYELLTPAIDDMGKCLLYDRSVVVDEAKIIAKLSGKGGPGACAYPSHTSSSYTSGSSAAVKMQARLDRIRDKERQGTVIRSKPCRMRGKQKPPPWVAEAGTDLQCVVCNESGP